MPRDARKARLTLNRSEADALLEPAGEGGQQGFHEMLRAQLKDGDLSVELGDADLGKLIRYMTQYGPGGFQGRLRNAFRRSLLALIKS